MVSTLAGTYTVDLTRVVSSPKNQNDSCQRLTVTMGARSTWPW